MKKKAHIFIFIFGTLIFQVSLLQVEAATAVRIFLVSTTTTSWTVPGDWNNVNNTIEVIGGGSGGDYGYGGGGGAYSKVSNVTLTAGSTVTVNVGRAGQISGAAAGDTYLCNSTSNCASIAGSAVQVGAKGGTSGASGAGGQASAGVGTVKYSGGNPSTPRALDDGCAAGGGAGGPNGNGGNGGSASGSAFYAAGGGGGGGGSDGGVATGSVGGSGGNNYLGSGSGAGGGFASPGSSGTAGGGGGGSGIAGGPGGGAGGNGTEWDATHGSGGGAGGTCQSTGGPGGSGGLYGGGGNSSAYSSAGSDGAQGIIVITYYPKTILSKPVNNLGLVNSWSFNEGTSTLAHDFSGTSNHGTLTNIANPPTGTSGWTTIGKAAGGLNLDGTNDKVVMGASYASTSRSGLLAAAYTGMNFNTFVGNFVDPTIDFNPADTTLGTNRVGTGDAFSYRWTGYVKADYSETYTFYTQSDDGVRLYVNGSTIVDNWTDHAPVQNSGTIALTAGMWYPITLEFYENGGGSVIQLQWNSTSIGGQTIIPASNLITSLEFAKSISFWVKPNSIASQGLMTVGTSSSIGTDGSGNISVTGFSSPTYYVNGVQTGSPKLVANQWNLVTVTTATAIPITGVSFGTDNTNFTNGTIDDAKIYSRVLSANEISGLYNGPKSVIVGGGETKQVTSGLVGHWPFNGKDISWSSASAGVAYDRSASRNTGTITGMDQAVNITQGKIGQALSFDGSTDYVSVDNSSSLDISSGGSVSMCSWVYFSGGSGYRSIMAKRNDSLGSPYAYGINFLANTNLQVYTSGSSGVQAFGYTLPINTWTHVCGIISTNPTALYVNGELYGTLGSGGGVISNTAKFLIGADLDGGSNPTEFFPGKLDDVRVYNKPLSASEIKQLYNLGKVTTKR